MLKLSDIFTLSTLLFLIVLVVVVSLLIVYITTNLSLNLFVLWVFVVAVLFFSFLGVILFFKRTNDKVLSDLKELIEYLQEINNKNYEAVVKTKHFSEFLQIELLLKNIVKRLHKKDHKK